MLWWDMSTNQGSENVSHMLITYHMHGLHSYGMQVQWLWKYGPSRLPGKSFWGVLLGNLTHHFHAWVWLAKDAHLTRAYADKLHSRPWKSSLLTFIFILEDCCQHILLSYKPSSLNLRIFGPLCYMHTLCSSFRVLSVLWLLEIL